LSLLTQKEFPVVAYITRFILVYKVSPKIHLIQSEISRQDYCEDFPLHALTQGAEGVRREWKEFVIKFGVHFDEYETQEVAQGISQFFPHAPCVAIRLRGGAHRLLLTTEQLKQCRGNISLFLEKLERMMEARNLEIADDPSSVTQIAPKQIA
jgi:hypothetical protein